MYSPTRPRHQLLTSIPHQTGKSQDYFLAQTAHEQLTIKIYQLWCGSVATKERRNFHMSVLLSLLMHILKVLAYLHPVHVCLCKCVAQLYTETSGEQIPSYRYCRIQVPLLFTMNLWLYHSPIPLPMQGQEFVASVICGPTGITCIKELQHFLPAISRDLPLCALSLITDIILHWWNWIAVLCIKWLYGGGMCV